MNSEVVEKALVANGDTISMSEPGTVKLYSNPGDVQSALREGSDLILSVDGHEIVLKDFYLSEVNILQLSDDNLGMIWDTAVYPTESSGFVPMDFIPVTGDGAAGALVAGSTGAAGFGSVALGTLAGVAGLASLGLAASSFNSDSSPSSRARSNPEPEQPSRPATTATPILDSFSDTGSEGDGLTSNSQPTLRGVGATSGDTVTLYDTDGTTGIGTSIVAVNGTWSVTPDAPLTEGSHSLSVTMTDAAGNESNPSATLSLVIDTTAPDAPSTPVLDSSSDSGTEGDNITNDTRPAITGSGATPGDAVTLYDTDGTSVLGTAMVAGDGTWSVTPDAPLSEGSHDLSVTMTDGAGNQGLPSPALRLVIDTNAPGTSTPVLEADSDTGVKGDNVTSETQPVLSGSGATAGETVTLYDTDGMTVLGTATIAVDGTWSVTPDAPLSEGAHDLSVSMTDEAGIEGVASAPLTVVIDTTAPDAPGNSPVLDSASDSGVQGDNITNDTQPAITGSGGNPGETATLYGTDGTTILGIGTVAANGTWSITPDAPLSEGSHDLSVRMTDAAGNESDPSSALTLVVDTTAPDAPSAPVLDSGSDSGTQGDNTTNDTQPAITGSGAAPGDTVTLYDTDGITVLGTTTVAGDGSWSVTPDAPLSEGSHNLSVTMTDAAGNESGASSALTLVVDTTAPDAPSAPVLDSVSDSGTQGDNTTNDTRPAITGSGATPGDTVTLYDTDSTAVLGIGMVAGDGTWSITPDAPLSEGSHDLSVTMTDPAGNESDPPAAFSLVIDTTAPNAPAAPTLDLGSDSGIQGDNTTNNTQPAITGSGATPGDTVTLYDTDGTTVLGTTTVAGDGSWSVAPNAPLSEGSHDLSVTMTDVAGNESGPSAALTLAIDTIAPDAPSAPVLDSGSDSGTQGDDITNITQPAISGSGAAPGDTVTLYDTNGTTVLGTGTVAVDGTWSVTPDAPLSEDSHDLSVTMTDPAGNESDPSTTLSLDIDTTAPDAPAAPILDLGSDSGTQGDNTANDTQPAITGSGATPGDTVTLYDTDGTTVLGTGTVAANGTWSIIPDAPLSEGSHDVSVTMTDAAGNESDPSAALTLVVDTTAPDAPSAPVLDSGSDSGTQGDNTTNDTQPAITGSGATPGDTVTLYDTDGTTVLGTGTVAVDGTWSVIPDAPLSEGSHDVSVTMTDAAGNESDTSSALSLVIDTMAPDAPAAPILDSGSDSGTQGDNTTNNTQPAVTGSGATPGDTVTLYDTDSTTILGTGTVAGDGTWSITPDAPLSEGSHDLSVTMTDPAGNESDPSAALSLDIDTMAPDAPAAPILDSGSDSGTQGDNTTNNTQPAITGSGATPGDTVTLYDTDGTTVLGTTTVAGDGSWSVAPNAPLSEGSHDLSVTMTDVAGNESGPSAALTLAIDTIAPDAPSAPVLDSGSDSGTQGDDITNITQPAISGSGAAPGDTVTLYDTNGTTVLGTGTVAVDGTWSVTPDAPLSEGSHDLSVTMTDPAGNESDPSTTLSLDIDTTAPDAPSAPVLDSGSDSGTQGDNTTNDTQPAITGSGATPGDTVTLYDTDGTTVLGTTTVAGDGSWSVTPNAPLSEGSHNLSVTMTDAAGNESDTSSALSLVIDTMAPDAPAAPILDSGSDSGTQGDNTTNNTQPAVTGSGATPGDTVTLYDTDSTTILGTGTVAGDGTWSITPDAPLSEGSHDLSVTMTDAAGNESGPSTTLSLDIDTTAPDAPAAPILDSGSDSGTQGDNTTNNTQPAITGSGATPGDTVTLYDTDGTTVLGTGTVAANGTWSITPDAPLSEGSHDLSVTMTDAAGNESDPSAALSLDIDTTAPNAPSAPILDSGSDSGTQGDNTTNDTQPAITGSGATPGDTVTLYDTDGTTVLGATTVAGDGSWSIIPAAPLAEGSHDLSVTMTETAAGNESAPSAALSIVIDTTAPNTPATAPILDSASDSGVLGDNTTNNTQPAVTGTGATPGDTVTLYDTDSTTVLGIGTVAGDGTWSITPNASLSEGSHDLSVTMTDAAGNESGPSSVLTLVVDTTAPDAPSAPVLDSGSDSGTQGDNTTNNTQPAVTGSGATPGDTVTLYDTDSTTILGTGTVAGDGTWSITPDAPLSEGSHDLSVTMTDAGGNESGPSTTLSLDIDTTAPDAPAAPILDSGSDSGTQGDNTTNNTQPAVTGSGATPGDAVTLYDTDGTTVLGTATIAGDGSWSVIPDAPLSEGPHSLSVTVTDSAENESAASVALTVTIDTTGPSITESVSSVSEEGLTGGAADTNGSPTDSTDATSASGTMAFSDASTITEVAVTGPTGIAAAGETVNWTGSFDGNAYTLTGATISAGTIATLTVNTAGEYSFALAQSLDHPEQFIEAILSLEFTVEATDSAGNVSSTGALFVNVEDDMPVAAESVVHDVVATNTPISGSFVDTFGADGGHLSSVTVDGYTFEYDSDANSVSAYGSSDTVSEFSEADFNAGSGELTVTTLKGETLLINVNDGTYQYNHTGVAQLPEEAPVAPVVSLGDTNSLLGLVGVGALGLVNFAESQEFSAVDDNSDINSVTITYTAISVSVGGGFNVVGAQDMASELGISFTLDDLGVLDLTGSITVTADDGGTISNLALNEFLGAIYLDSGVLSLGIGTSLTIAASDSAGNTDSFTRSDLADLGLMQTDAPDYLVVGDSGDNALNGTGNADRLYGYQGNDSLTGLGGSDILRGGDGNDTLDGGAGNDILIGGAGNDTLSGGDGLDVFRWESGDESLPASPQTDTISDFTFAPVSAGGDTLDLADLLQGEGRIGMDPGNLANYLHFEWNASATTISVSTTGGFLGGFDAAQVDQVIVLTGVDLTQGSISDQDIIADLIGQGALLVDEATADTDLLGGVTSVTGIITDGDGDSSASSVGFDSTGTPSPTSPMANLAAPVVQADTSALLGIAGIDALGLINLNSQDLTAADSDGNLRSVVVDYQPILSVNLDAQTLTASTQLAAELGLQFTIENDPGVLGLVAPSSRLTITAIDDGDIDNLAINEFLATVQFDNGQSLLGLNLEAQAALLDATLITAIDAGGLSASESLGQLTNVVVLSSLLGNEDVMEGDGLGNVLNGDASHERLYGFDGDDVIDGSAGDDLIRGGAGNDTLIGGDGNDTLIDGNGQDSFSGGAGDDLMSVSSDQFDSIDGGEGFDVLVLDDGIDIDFSSFGLGSVSNIEQIHLGNDDSGTTLTLTEEALVAMTEADNELMVIGDGNDTVDLSGATLEAANQVINGATYDVFNFGSGTLLADTDVNVII
ncbi:Ig-like domain-containing protein [Marinobacter sp.]|uniref:Ig-like domain-containing protein n=1 Tax=Marinobacter sp. TaxID=50741 RepID=UPI003B52AEF6